MAAVTAVAAASTATTATAQVSRHPVKPSPHLAPSIVAAAYWHKAAILGRCAKASGAHKRLVSSNSSVVCEFNLTALPGVSVRASSHELHQPLHAIPSKDKLFSPVSAASSLFGNQDGPPYRILGLPKERRSFKPPRAYKNDFFTFRYPVITEKPEWWWRTLACIPYLISLQMSDTGYFIQPFLEHYNFLGDLIYYIPGAITRLPTWFIMVYYYFSYIGIVKNKAWPHFFRFHLMMGMLMETGLQVIWYASNFFPLIHYNGMLGMHYWAGVGFAYMLIMLQCVRCALAGGYANVPFLSDNAYIHTLFNIGGYQRPFY